METDSKVSAVLMPANPDKAVILTFNSYEEIHGTRLWLPQIGWIWAKLTENLQKGFAIPDAIENTRDPWEEVETATLTGVWEKLISTCMDDFEGFKTSAEEVTADGVDTAREPAGDVQPEDETGLPPS